MNYSVYLRPLKITDAKTSYKWRNNPLIWKFTEFKPNKKIDIATEMDWIKKVLKCKNEHRFAICLLETGQYLGNIQLINIADKAGYFHVFIGETSFWGKGIAKEATQLLLNYGFKKLGLDFINLKVHQDNNIAKSIYQKMGFHSIGIDADFMVMTLEKNHFLGLKQKEKLEEMIYQQEVLMPN
jgi:RimJ/RimL family protein N-acetyltransferase